MHVLYVILCIFVDKGKRCHLPRISLLARAVSVPSLAGPDGHQRLYFRSPVDHPGKCVHSQVLQSTLPSSLGTCLVSNSLPCAILDIDTLPKELL